MRDIFKGHKINEHFNIFNMSLLEDQKIQKKL